MTQLQTYRPLVKITTYDDKVFYILEEHKKEFEQLIESQKFVKVQGATIAVRDIRRIESAKENYSEVPSEFRDAISIRSQKYLENLGKNPDPEIIMKWVVKLKNGEVI